jgi:hypothetical protein
MHSGAIRVHAIAAAAALLAGCMTGPGSPPLEYFRYTYKIAHQQPDGTYRVPVRGQDGACSRTIDLRQNQIVDGIRRQEANLFDCVSDYTVPVRDNRAQGLGISARLLGDPSTNQSSLDVRAERIALTGTQAEPTNIFLQGVGPVAPGPLSGFAENNFGTTGPIFTTERAGASFFEYQLATLDLGARRVAGSFRFLATNKDDPNDNRLLIVVDSGYLMNLD